MKLLLGTKGEKSETCFPLFAPESLRPSSEYKNMNKESSKSGI
jgi:hypothetical protein